MFDAVEINPRLARLRWFGPVRGHDSEGIAEVGTGRLPPGAGTQRTFMNVARRKKTEGGRWGRGECESV